VTDLDGLDGTYNFRDLGGLPLANGGATAPGVFFRADALHALSPRGVEQLTVSPIGVVVDFRTGVERDTARDRLPSARRVREVHLPLLEGAMAHLIEESLAAHALGDSEAARRAVTEALQSLPTLADLYGGMLGHGASTFARVAQLLADEKNGVLIHCTAGKDRTGVATAVILDAVGVERDAIVADYALSQERLSGAWFDRMRGMVTMMGVEVTPALAELMAGSPPAAIEAVLDLLDANGGARAYLRSGGATDADFARLTARLTA
jgi:protein-tyrosine phosphatase